MRWEALLATLTILSALGTGLVAGVFYAFSTFVLRALHLRPPVEGIAAMQSINRVVINPKFLGVFVGTMILSVAVAVLACVRSPGNAVWVVAGAALYSLGCFAVTMFGNVPLNEVLAVVTPEQPDASARWDDYVRRWSLWNHIRTAAALAASAAFIVSLQH